MKVKDLDYFWGMIENKVANSKLITLDIAEEVEAFAGVALDIAPQLWQGAPRRVTQAFRRAARLVWEGVPALQD